MVTDLVWATGAREKVIFLLRLSILTRSLVYPRKKATLSQCSLEEGQTEKCVYRIVSLRIQEFVNLGGSRFHVLSYPT